MLAIGDSYNDIAMLKWAGIGVAVANAPQMVKAAADYVTASNDEDGVAEALEKWVLNPQADPAALTGIGTGWPGEDKVESV